VPRPCEAPASHTCGGLTAVDEQAPAGRQTDPWASLKLRAGNRLMGQHKVPSNPVSGKVSSRLKKNHGIVRESPCARQADRRRNSFTAKKVPVPEQSAGGAERLAALRYRGQPLAVQGEADGRRQGNRQAVEARLAEAPPSHTWRGLSLLRGSLLCLVCSRRGLLAARSRAAGSGSPACCPADIATPGPGLS
jgi:hypothetical protein